MSQESTNVRAWDGRFGKIPSETRGFNQELIDTDGKAITIHPFHIGPSGTCPKSTVNGTLSPATGALDLLAKRSEGWRVEESLVGAGLVSWKIEGASAWDTMSRSVGPALLQ